LRVRRPEKLPLDAAVARAILLQLEPATLDMREAIIHQVDIEPQLVRKRKAANLRLDTQNTLLVGVVVKDQDPAGVSVGEADRAAPRYRPIRPARRGREQARAEQTHRKA
jgi:hypothetical protein